MASTLLAAPCFLSLQNREVGGFLGSFRSPNYDKMKYNQGLLRKRNSGTNGGGSPVVASVFERKVKSRQTVIPEPDYRIPIVLLGLSGGLAYTNNLLPAAPIGLLELLLLFQTRVRFVFDDEALEVKVGEQLQNSGENVFSKRMGSNFMMLCWRELALPKPVGQKILEGRSIVVTTIQILLSDSKDVNLLR